MPDVGNYRYSGVARRPLRENATADIAVIISARLDVTLSAVIFKAARSLLRAKHRRRRGDESLLDSGSADSRS